MDKPTKTEQLTAELMDSLLEDGITNFNDIFYCFYTEFCRRADLCNDLGDAEGYALMNSWAEWFAEFGETCGIGDTKRPDLIKK